MRVLLDALTFHRLLVEEVQDYSWVDSMVLFLHFLVVQFSHMSFVWFFLCFTIFNNFHLFNIFFTFNPTMVYIISLFSSVIIIYWYIKNNKFKAFYLNERGNNFLSIYYLIFTFLVEFQQHQYHQMIWLCTHHFHSPH